jgi:hypothetical protein
MNNVVQWLKDRTVEFPLRARQSIDGVIADLTRKHGGKVHDTGIITITSRSVYDDNPKYAARNVADLACHTFFYSKSGPDEWLCWDFRKMRVNPTHYTMRSGNVKSCVIESSLDGVNWTEIDRRTNIKHYEVSAVVSKSAECRFIRLTQTGKRHYGNDYLSPSSFGSLEIDAFGLFGTLLE